MTEEQGDQGQELVLPCFAPECLAVFDALQSPFWIYNISQSSMDWANKAALELWDAADVAELHDRNFAAMSDATRHRLKSYIQRFKAGEKITETWSLYPQGKPMTMVCALQGVQLDGGDVGMFVEATPMSAELASPEVLRSVEALRHTTSILSIIDLQGKVLLRNPQALKVYGTIDGQPGEWLQCFKHIEDGQRLLSEVMNLGSYHDDVLVVADDYQEFHHAFELRMMRDPAGEGALILINERDITARVKEKAQLEEAKDHLEMRVVSRTLELVMVNEQLKESEQRFRDFAAAASDWYWELDEDLQLSYLSDRACLLIGKTEEEVLGHCLWELAPDDVAADPRKWDRLRRALEKHEPIRGFTFEMPTFTGDVKTMRLGGVPVMVEDDVFDGYRGSAADATNELLAAQKAVKAQTQLLDAVEALSDGFALFNAAGNLELSNTKFKAIYAPVGHLLARDVGYQDLITAAVNSGLVDTQDETPEAFLQRRLRAHRLANSIETLRFKDDRWFMVSEQRTSEGGVVQVTTDISELKHSENQRRELDAKLNQARKVQAIAHLAGGLAHDLNNMLVPVLTLSQMGQRELDESHPVRMDLVQIEKASRRAKAIVEEMLTFSRAHRPKLQRHQLVQVLEEALSFVGPTVPEGAHLEVDLQAQDLCAMVDTGQIERLVMNLCKNGFDAMEAATDKTLTVRLEKVAVAKLPAFVQDVLPEGEAACLTIADKGHGMDEETRQHIFNPFFTTKSVGKGTGLGLAVVDGIVTSHKGMIQVESVEGQGTAFKIYLPSCGTEGA